MTIERITDTGQLVQSRLDYFAADGHMPEGDREEIVAHLKDYFARHAGADDLIALAGWEGDETVSGGFLAIRGMPARSLHHN